MGETQSYMETTLVSLLVGFFAGRHGDRWVSHQEGHTYQIWIYLSILSMMGKHDRIPITLSCQLDAVGPGFTVT